MILPSSSETSSVESTLKELCSFSILYANLLLFSVMLNHKCSFYTSRTKMLKAKFCHVERDCRLNMYVVGLVF